MKRGPGVVVLIKNGIGFFLLKIIDIRDGRMVVFQKIKTSNHAWIAIVFEQGATMIIMFECHIRPYIRPGLIFWIKL